MDENSPVVKQGSGFKLFFLVRLKLHGHLLYLSLAGAKIELNWAILNSLVFFESEDVPTQQGRFNFFRLRGSF